MTRARAIAAAPRQLDGRCASRISSKFRDGGNTSIERYVIQHSCASFARTYVFITQPILTQAALAEITNRPCPRLLVSLFKFRLNPKSEKSLRNDLEVSGIPKMITKCPCRTWPSATY